MAKYDKDTRFYWCMLPEDFFQNEAISWLEEQQPKGREYVYFYIKLCLLSLKYNGILIRNVGNFVVPYDNKHLSQLTKIDFDTVCVAMELLSEIGLVQILSNKEIYLPQIEDMIGSKSLGAFKKQQQRAVSDQDQKKLKSFKKLQKKLEGGQKVDICPPDKELELEKEIDKDYLLQYKENNFSEKEIKKIKSLFEFYKGFLEEDNINEEDDDFSLNDYKKIKQILKKDYTTQDIRYVFDYLHYRWVEHPELNIKPMEEFYRPKTLLDPTKFKDRLKNALRWINKEESD